MNVEEEKKSNMRKKNRIRYFESYILKIIKKLSTNSITINSKQQFNSVLCILSRIISSKAIRLTQISKKKTISDKEIKNAVYLTLTNDLSDKADEYAQDILIKYSNYNNDKKGVTRQEKAEIIFPPSLLEKFLRDFGYSKIMVSSISPVYFAAIMEYMASEMMKSIISYTQENKRIRITIRDLEMGIRNNQDFNSIFIKNNISFLGGGSVPFIHESLLNKKHKKSSVINSDSEHKKKHRFRPGTVSLKEIKKYQKMSNCLTFAKFPFEKLVRKLFCDYTGKDKIKISKDVFAVLQYFVEQNIVSLLHNSNLAAIHSGRVKLVPSDINFILNLKNQEYIKNDIVEEINVHVEE